MAKTIEIEVKVDSKQAVQGVDALDNSVKGLNETSEKATSQQESLSSSLEATGGSFGGAISGAKALGKQFIALIANPIGLVIAAIAVVLGTLYKAFARTEQGSGKLNKGMKILSGAMSSLLKALEPLANFIVDKVIGAFDLMAKSASLAAEAVSDALEFFGFDEAAKSVRNFTDATSDLIDKTTELADLENELLKSRREQRLIEKQALIDAEKLRQQRDDESNSLKERIEFNKQLGAVLDKQSKDELAIANKALKAAQLKLDIDGETTEALDGLADAQLEILDINERINGQLSEQLANENSLRNEGIANAKEAAVKRNEILKAEEVEKARILAEANKAADDLLNIEIESQKKKNEVQKAAEDKALEDKKKRLAEELEAEKTVAATKEQIRQANISSISSGIDLIASLDEDNKALQAASIIASNATGIARTIISTQAANATAFAEGSALAIPSGGASVAAAAALIAANNINAGISVGTSIVATAKGLAALKKGGSTGSKPSLSGGASASTSGLSEDALFSRGSLEAPDTETVGGSAGINQQPVQAIVLESDITNTQNRINNYQERSEIG